MKLGVPSFSLTIFHPSRWACPALHCLTQLANSHTDMPPKPRPETVPDRTPSPELVDHSAAISSVEADLNRHCLGSFHVVFKDMNFKWKDRDNRDLQVNPEKLGKLLTSMRNGLYRAQIRNRMSGVVPTDALSNRIHSPDDPKIRLSLADVKRYNQEAKFPVIAISRSGGPMQRIEMQSGQHRMAVLRTLFKNKQPQWWWIVTLYDDSTPLLPESPVLTSRSALDRQRGIEIE